MIALTLTEVAQLTGGRLVGGGDGAATVSGGVTLDSRTVAPGDLFVAVAGAMRRVLRHVLIDTDRLARSHRETPHDTLPVEGEVDGGYETLLDRGVLSAVLDGLSPAHREVLVETYYRDAPADRFATAEEMHDALLASLGKQFVSAQELGQAAIDTRVALGLTPRSQRASQRPSAPATDNVITRKVVVVKAS